MNVKRMSISLIANAIAFAVNIGINFFLTPYIVNHIGSEAYGFVALASNFTSYAQILTIALNSMAGRFITVAYANKDYEKANKYFNSVFVSNIIISLVMLIPAIVIVLKLDSVINISSELVPDIKCLFALIFAAFFVTIIGTTFTESTFVANRLDLQAKRNIESHVLKALILLGLYFFFRPYTFYMGIGTLSSAVFLLLVNISYTKRLLPEIKIDIRNFSRAHVRELITSGMWNSVNRFSVVLSDGLDLLITNLFISPAMMGLLSLAKMVPSVLSSLITTLGGVFSPGFTIAYARENKEELLSQIRTAIIILSIMNNIALCTLAVVGKEFFSLWVPGQDAGMLHILSLLVISGLVVHGGVQSVYNLFTVTNKVKMNSIVTLIVSAFNILVVFVIVKLTDYGVYAVAGVSAVTVNLRSLIFAIPYAAYCIKVDRSVFYKPVAMNLIALAVSLAAGYLIKQLIHVTGWLTFFTLSAVVAIMAGTISLIIATNKREKMHLIAFAKNKIIKKRG